MRGEEFLSIGGVFESPLAAKLKESIEKTPEFRIGIIKPLERFGEALGKDWYNFRVRGFAVGVTEDSLQERWISFDQQLLALDEQSRAVALFAFCRGLGAERRPGREEERYISRLADYFSVDPVRQLIISLSKGSLPVGAKAIILLKAIIDLSEDPEKTADELKSYLTEPTRYNMFFGEVQFIALPELLPALNYWHEDRRET